MKKEKPRTKTELDFLPDADEIERRPLPRSAQMTLYVLFAAVVCFILWASFSETDLIVTARGKLVTPLPNIVVQPLDSSIVQTIDVRTGQVVKKGQRLATLDPTFTEADEAQLRTRLRSMDTQLKRLDVELSGRRLSLDDTLDPDALLQFRLAEERRSNYAAQKQRFDEGIARLRAALETARADQAGMASRIKVLIEAESLQADLVAQRYAVRARWLDAQERLLDARRGMELSHNKDQELRKELGALEAEKLSFETGWRQKTMEELLSVSRERDSVNEQLQKADKRNQLVTLVSPSDAVVLEIAKLSPGSVARATEAMFTLVPLGGELEAEVKIDAVDIGYVKLGDVAHIKLDSYPFQKHGSLIGELRTISEDAFKREGDATIAMEAYYASRIKLKTTHLNNMRPQARLLPGMMVSAEISVGKRSIISYIIWPLIRALDESVREP